MDILMKYKNLLYDKYNIWKFNAFWFNIIHVQIEFGLQMDKTLLVMELSRLRDLEIEILLEG